VNSLYSSPFSGLGVSVGKNLRSLVGIVDEPKRFIEKELKKRKRAFHRLVSGFTRARSHGCRLRFLTLTTGKDGDSKRLSRDIQILRKRIERATRWLIDRNSDYALDNVGNRIEKDGFDGFKIDYWKINTNEGNGVSHIIFKGGYIPYAWLSKQWEDIHGAWNIDIRSLFGKPKQMVNYLIRGYLTNQSFERMSWSWGWVFRGFCTVWKKQFAGWYRKDKKACLIAWDNLICTYQTPIGGVQLAIG